MLSKSPIRNKLFVGIGLLLVIVAALSGSGLYAVSVYRSAVKSFRGRADELPPAKDISKQVSDLRVMLAELSALDSQGLDDAAREVIATRFDTELDLVKETLDEYHKRLVQNDEESTAIGDSHEEHEIVRQMYTALQTIAQRAGQPAWLADSDRLEGVRMGLERLQELSWILPSFLHKRFHGFAGQVRSQYYALRLLTGVISISAAVLLGLFIRLFYAWVFRPLHVLVDGSRRVAGGEFGYRIMLNTHDEISELADAMNAMTARFEAIRDDLDGQVRERTKQVVRSEQLASVGFLAAGVAHEINNPLASIALCAESLEGRIADAMAEAPTVADADRQVITNYLRMIQNEAFRCKGITERLLDFSRMGDLTRQSTDLRELVQGVIDMVRHLGRYQDKHIVLADGPTVIAPVNSQELKQVVLNLITNALDSLSAGGTLEIVLAAHDGHAVLVFTDNGCGMTDEVLQHLFEPFFTRRRHGQGTGLGLSITYRIVADHGGHIDVHSEGPGRGSQFRVSLPLIETHAIDKTQGASGKTALVHKETSNRYQAA